MNRQPSQPSCQRGHQCEAGQALIEFAFVFLLLTALLFGVIEYGRAIYFKQVMMNVSREGANLASRGTTLSDTVAAMTNSASPLNMTTRGRVIVSTVYSSNGVFMVTDQQALGGFAAASKIGTKGSPPIYLPAGVPSTNQTLYVAEVYYTFTPLTPIGRLIGASAFTNMYDVAYF